jgi:hypothetical protein
MDPDQTALVWIHAGRKRIMLVLSWRGSIIVLEHFFYLETSVDVFTWR